MSLISSNVIWTDESFELIRAAVESSLHLADAIERSEFDVLQYDSVLSAILSNTEMPGVMQWLQEFASQWAARADAWPHLPGAAAMEFRACRFEPSDPMQTLYFNKNHMFAASLRYLGNRIILHDVPFDKDMAEWAIQKCLSIGWPTDDCRIIVKTPPDGNIHLATLGLFCANRGLLRTGIARVRRKRV